MDEKHAQSPSYFKFGSFCFGVKAHLNQPVSGCVFAKKKVCDVVKVVIIQKLI
jgi:hypothetical protein